MRTLFASLFALALIALVAAPDAGHSAMMRRGTYVASGCLFPSPPGYDDGCQSGYATGSLAPIGRGNFFSATWAQASYASNPSIVPYPTLPGWNVAGVDAPEGYPTPPTLDPFASVPAGCTVQVNGVSPYSTVPTLVCQATTGAPAISLVGYDFTGAHSGGDACGSNGCPANGIFLLIKQSSVAGCTVDIEKSAFGGGIVGGAPSNTYGRNMIYFPAGGTGNGCNTTINYNDFNGNWTPAEVVTGAQATFSGTTMTLTTAPTSGSFAVGMAVTAPGDVSFNAANAVITGLASGTPNTVGAVYNMVGANNFATATAIGATMQYDAIDWTWSAGLTVEHNVFHALEDRPIISGYGPATGNTFVFDYNYVGPTTASGYGICNNCGGTGFHGEVWQSTPKAGQSVGYMESRFNTLYIPPNAPWSSWSAPFFVAGAPNYVNQVSAVSIDHNVLINSICGNSSCQSGPNVNVIDGVALVYLRYAQVGTLTVQNNFVDPAGTFQCFRQEGSLNGVQATLSGTSVTISGWNTTSGQPASPIFLPGWLYTTTGTIITPTYVTGPSGAQGSGTYTGSVSQTATITAGLLTGSVGTLNLPQTNAGGNANIDLEDGSVIWGTGYDLNQSGSTCARRYG